MILLGRNTDMFMNPLRDILNDLKGYNSLSLSRMVSGIEALKERLDSVDQKLDIINKRMDCLMENQENKGIGNGFGDINQTPEAMLMRWKRIFNDPMPNGPASNEALVEVMETKEREVGEVNENNIENNNEVNIEDNTDNDLTKSNLSLNESNLSLNESWSNDTSSKTLDITPIGSPPSSKKVLNYSTSITGKAPVKHSNHVPRTMSLSRNINTIVELEKEWYQSSNGFMCVSDRDQKFGTAWRNSGAEQSFYKKRKRIINFMDKLISDGSSLCAGMSTAQIASYLECVRREKDVGIRPFGDLCLSDPKELKKCLMKYVVNDYE